MLDVQVAPEGLIERSTLIIQHSSEAGRRGCSSIGRAPALQAGGRRFDPDQLHHEQLSRNGRVSLLVIHHPRRRIDRENQR